LFAVFHFQQCDIATLSAKRCCGCKFQAMLLQPGWQLAGLADNTLLVMMLAAAG
jgi:hypothetical protein